MQYDLNLRAHVENDLANLEEGYRELMQRREQIERQLEQQSGGIAYAKRLLEKIDEGDESKKGSTVDVLPSERMDVKSFEKSVGQMLDGAGLR